MKYKDTQQGFTLIELLIAILIIGILVAVALPQYKHAVLKSRFSTVMPIAKSIADAQEVYYLSRNTYALSTDELDITPTTAEKTTVNISDRDGYDYVLAQHTDVPELHYVIYQKHSEQFPEEIHCEALEDDTYAEKVCKSLGATQEIGQTLTEGFLTYILNGTGNGVSPANGSDDNDTPVELDAETLAKLQAQVNNCPSGYECFINKTSGTVIKCNAGYGGQVVNGKCVPTRATGILAYQEEYNTEGQKVEAFACRSFTNDTCTGYWEQFYSYNPNRYTEIVCADTTMPSAGICPNNNYTAAYEGTRDSSGNFVSSNTCVISSIDSKGKCGEYSRMTTYDNSYDNNNNRSYTASDCADISGTTCKSWIKNSAKVYNADGSYTQVYCPYTGLKFNCDGHWLQYSSKTGQSSTCSTVNWETATCN